MSEQPIIVYRIDQKDPKIIAAYHKVDQEFAAIIRERKASMERDLEQARRSSARDYSVYL